MRWAGTAARAGICSRAAGAGHYYSAAADCTTRHLLSGDIYRPCDLPRQKRRYSLFINFIEVFSIDRMSGICL
jgi:hypothetical protein